MYCLIVTYLCLILYPTVELTCVRICIFKVVVFSENIFIFSTFVDPDLRKAMGEQAVSLAKAVGYDSAG